MACWCGPKIDHDVIMRLTMTIDGEHGISIELFINHNWPTGLLIPSKTMVDVEIDTHIIYHIFGSIQWGCLIWGVGWIIIHYIYIIIYSIYIYIVYQWEHREKHGIIWDDTARFNRVEVYEWRARDHELSSKFLVVFPRWTMPCQTW